MKVLKLIKEAKKAFRAKHAQYKIEVVNLDGVAGTAKDGKVLSTHYSYSVRDALEWLDAQLIGDAVILTDRHSLFDAGTIYCKFAGSKDLVKIGKGY